VTKLPKYSLWVVPAAGTKLSAKLSLCIAQISEQYRTPIFTPHVTLLGDIDGAQDDVRQKCHQLVSFLPAYKIRLGKISSNGTYFQILFSKVKETAGVMRANSFAQEIFNMSQKDYFPHLSLAYGNFSLNEIKTLKADIRQKQIKTVGKKFVARRIELWQTEGPVADWKKIAIFRLYR